MSSCTALSLGLALGIGFLLVVGGCKKTADTSPRETFPFERVSTDPPLPPCADSLPCIRETVRLPATSPSQALEAVHDVLDRMEAVSVSLDDSARQVSAVFRVFLLQDNFDLQIDKDKRGSLLHVRSTSYMAARDLNINRERLNQFYGYLAEELRPNE